MTSSSLWSGTVLNSSVNCWYHESLNCSKLFCLLLRFAWGCLSPEFSKQFVSKLTHEHTCWAKHSEAIVYQMCFIRHDGLELASACSQLRTYPVAPLNRERLRCYLNPYFVSICKIYNNHNIYNQFMQPRSTNAAAESYLQKSQTLYSVF